VSVAAHMSSNIDCGLCMPVQYHVGSQVYGTLDFASKLLGCTETREQYMLAMTLINVLKLDNGYQILTQYCIIKFAMHVATTAFV